MMRDVLTDRAEVTRLVYRRLAEPAFRERLLVQDDEGTHPIIVALRSDTVGSLVSEVAAVGGAANVAIPALNGVVFVAMVGEPARPARSATKGTARAKHLSASCTVGVFLEQLGYDGGEGRYRFVIEGPERQRERVSAQAVAVAG